MKYRLAIAAFLIGISSMQPAATQSSKGATAVNAHPPTLGDIMAMVQSRHIKLWLAGKQMNWDLAAYELTQLRAGLEDAAALYPRIPVTNVTTMADPVDSLAAAVRAKDREKFAKGYGELTAGCNSCHQSMGMSFVAIQTPAVSPFSDQSFVPPKKQQESK